MNDFSEIIKKINSLNLKEIKNYLDTIPKDEIFKLRDYLDDIYYNTGEQIMDDNRYDKIKEYLPIQSKVGAKLRDKENRINLPYWLGSADKITPEQNDVLERWLNKNKAKKSLSKHRERVNTLAKEVILNINNNQINQYNQNYSKIESQVRSSVPQ